MTRTAVIHYFNALAPTWDETLVHNDAIINSILDRAQIAAGQRVLDVACGTGVLFPDYLARNVARVVGVDISPNMARIAAEKFDDPKIEVLCADVQELKFRENFHRVMVYNAFPHFPEPARLIGRLAGDLLPGGRLTIAHGLSRAKLNAHHNGSARHVSVGLMSEDALAAIMAQWFHVDTALSDDEKYIVSGTLL